MKSVDGRVLRMGQEGYHMAQSCSRYDNWHAAALHHGARRHCRDAEGAITGIGY